MQPKTQEDIAYEKIMELIVHGKLPINEFLSQRKLAEQVGAAVITIRGALRRLENAGLIENVPRWGVRIPMEDEESIRDRYFMREVLELAAVKRIYEKGLTTDAEVFRLAEACDSFSDDDAEDSDNIDRFISLHFEFHHSIAKCSGSKALIEAVNRLGMKSLILWNARRGWARGLDRHQHMAYVKEIFSGDMERATKAAKEHMERGLQNELEAIKEQPSTPAS